MEITYWGYFVLLLLVPWLLTRDLKVALKVLIFLMPFETFGIINITKIKPFCIDTPHFMIMFLAFLLFTITIQKYLKHEEKIVLCGQGIPCPFTHNVILILLAVALSHIFGLFIMETQYPMSNSLTQTIYLLFNIFTFYLLCKALKVITAEDFSRILIMSMAIIACTGLLHLIFKDKIIPVFKLFRNNISMAGGIQDFIYITDAGVVRISGLMRESGTLAMLLLCGIVMLFTHKLYKVPLFSSIVDTLLLLFFMIITVLTTSSSIFVTLFVLILLIMVYVGKIDRNSLYRYIYLVKIIGLLVLVLSLIGLFKQISFKYLFERTIGQTGLFRVMGIADTRMTDTIKLLQLFAKDPVFGLGFGTSRLVGAGLATLLADVGIFGAGCFIYFFIRTVMHKRKFERNKDEVAALGIRFATFNLLAIYLASKGLAIGTNIFIWFMAAACVTSFKVFGEKGSG